MFIRLFLLSVFTFAALNGWAQVIQKANHDFLIKEVDSAVEAKRTLHIERGFVAIQVVAPSPGVQCEVGLASRLTLNVGVAGDVANWINFGINRYSGPPLAFTGELRFYNKYSLNHNFSHRLFFVGPYFKYCKFDYVET